MSLLLTLLLATSPTTPEAAFWSWFTRNADRVATIRNATEPVADELADRLASINPDLTFELGTSRRPYELIISAGGIKAAFPAVQRLVAAAPPISGWKIVAFRPRSAAGLIIEIGGYRVDPAEVWFEAERDGKKYGVTLYLPGFRNDTNGKQAGYLLLDGSLGEYDVETKLGFIDFKPLPADPVLAGLRPLSELPALVDHLAP
jgi:hypothetical protein